MGQKDIVTKQFMKQPEVFADAWNCFFEKGELVLRAEELHPLDPVEFGRTNPKLFERHRDVLKYWGGMADQKNAYLLLGIENQSDTDYSMPIRNMEYDVLRYKEQLEKRRQEPEKKGAWFCRSPLQ